MSIKLMAKVLEAYFPDMEYVSQDGKRHKIKGATINAVMLSYANHANDEGEATYPSLTLLERETNLSRRTAVNAVKAMRQNGLILPDGKSKRNTNRYIINLEKLEHFVRLGKEKFERASEPGSPEMVNPVHQASEPVALKPSINHQEPLSTIDANVDEVDEKSSLRPKRPNGNRKKKVNQETLARLRAKITAITSEPKPTREAAKRLTNLPYGAYIEALEQIGYTYDNHQWLIELIPTIAKATGKKKDRPSTVGEARALLQAVETLYEAGFNDAAIAEHIKSRAAYYAKENAGKLKPPLKWSSFCKGLASEKSIAYLKSRQSRAEKKQRGSVDRLLPEDELEAAVLQGA